MFFIFVDSMKKLYILKIGGSILTNKNSERLYLHKKRISKIAKQIKTALNKDPDLQLIIVHGAGGEVHHLAHKYSLQNGTGLNNNKLYGATLTRLAVQKLNTQIFNIFLENGLPVLPVHTSSTVIQKNKKISTLNTKIITGTINNNCIPLLYGDMTLDTVCGMSISSGDASTAYLAKHLDIKKIFLATDVQGIFTKDPYKYSDATLIKKTTLSNVFFAQNISLTKSHNTDTTDGMKGKLRSFNNLLPSKTATQQIILFDGTKPENYTKLLTNSYIPATYIDVV
jgi:isopentenyl phosphate kinase